MEQPIPFTYLNDFVFCPASVYFHMLYDDTDRALYQDSAQINGTAAHKAVDTNTYTGKLGNIQGISIYCEKLNLLGKIDLYDSTAHTLTERKNLVKQIYDGYVFQLYGQCFAMREMGYEVERLRIHSIQDNRSYDIPLPEDDNEKLTAFLKIIDDINSFDMDSFRQLNISKCQHCIYEPACDRGLKYAQHE